MKTNTSRLMDSHLVDFTNPNANNIKSGSTQLPQQETLYTEEQVKKAYFKGAADVHDKCTNRTWRGVETKVDIELLKKLNAEYIQSLKQLSQQEKIYTEEEFKKAVIDAYHTNPQEAKWKNIGINYYNETFGSKRNDAKDVVLGYKTSLDAQMLDSQLPQTTSEKWKEYQDWLNDK